MPSFESNYTSIMDQWGKEHVEFVSSGSVILDAVLGKGVPIGKFIEISSPSGLGKSTTVLHMCKYACASGKKVVYMDFEKGVNDSQLEGIGLVPFKEKLFFLVKPHTFEDAEVILDQILDDPELAYVVVDSVTAMLPAKVREKSIADIEPGLQARFASAFLLKYRGFAYDTKTTFIMVNQVRTTFNFRGQSRVEAAGGQAQKFYPDIRLEFALEKKLEKATDTIEGSKTIPYGSLVRVWATKNRYNRPYVEGIMTIHFGKGVSNIAAYIRWLVQKGFITQGGGGYYTIKISEQEQKVRGQVGLEKWIKENIDLVKSLIKEGGGFLLIKETEDGE